MTGPVPAYSPVRLAAASGKAGPAKKPALDGPYRPLKRYKILTRYRFRLSLAHKHPLTAPPPVRDPTAAFHAGARLTLKHDGGTTGMGFQPGVGQVVLARGDHEYIGSGIEQAQADVVLLMAAGVDGEAEIRWVL